MADKEDQYNDEYQFSDLDVLASDTGSAEAIPRVDDGVSVAPNEMKQDKLSFIDKDKKNIKRYAYIAIVLVVILLLIIKLIGSFFSARKEAKSVIVQPSSIQKTTESTSPPSQIEQIPSSLMASQSNVEIDRVRDELNQKLSSMEVGQESMHSDLSSVNGQVVELGAQLNTAVGKIAELQTALGNLNSKLDQQSRELLKLTLQQAAKKKPRVIHKAPQYLKYYIQAVIPGRAWLIATNGSTMTVRQGTALPGYGLVNFIDPNQGRVITSSGKIIRFSQDDS